MYGTENPRLYICIGYSLLAYETRSPVQLYSTSCTAETVQDEETYERRQEVPRSTFMGFQVLCIWYIKVVLQCLCIFSYVDYAFYIFVNIDMNIIFNFYLK